MGKRKQIKDGDVSMGGTDPAAGDSSDEDIDMVNVDFEWFDPQEIDFHGIKHLIRQLFDVDAQDLDLSGLADMILAQPLLGSTVKTDGKDSDPYAFLTVLNLQEHAVRLTYLKR
jgi:protein BCP1